MLRRKTLTRQHSGHNVPKILIFHVGIPVAIGGMKTIRKCVDWWLVSLSFLAFVALEWLLIYYFFRLLALI